MSYYPLFLDVQNRPCRVVGGGAVAARKVNMLLEHQGQVTVISPALCAELEGLARSGRVTAVRREYEAGDLEGAFVVIAATDNRAVNERVSQAAAERGILINVVDVPALSNFIVPSCLRRGDLTIAVSTGGRSPALARRIRTDLENAIGPEYAELVSVVEAVRDEMKETGVPVLPEVWQKALAAETLMELIRSGQPERAKDELRRSLAENRDQQ